MLATASMCGGAPFTLPILPFELNTVSLTR